MNDLPPQRNAVIPFARAAALRSTALATSLALAIGLADLPSMSGPAKLPCETAADRPQRRSQVHCHCAAPVRPRTPAVGPPLWRRRRLRPLLRQPSRACDPPACRLPPPAQARGAGSGSRDVLDVAGRQGRSGKHHRAGPQAEAWGRQPGPGRDIGSGRPQACGMADPAQRQQWRLRGALSRLCLGQSELAVADLPAPAHRGSPVGRPPRRRHGLVLVREQIAIRPRASSRWRRPCSRAAIAPMPNGWSARPGAMMACRKTPRARRSICSARC